MNPKALAALLAGTAVVAGPAAATATMAYVTSPRSLSAKAQVMVEEFANVRLRDEGLSSGTRRRILRPLKVLFATAVQRGHIKSNPAASLRITGKDVPKPEGYRKYLEREEVQRIIAGTPEGWKRTFIRTAALTGLRRCELFGLQWDDIDFDAGVLHVRRSVRKGKVDDTKTESSAREFPLGRSLAADLRKHKMASKFSKGTDFVFPTSTGRAQHDGNPYRWFKPIVVSAGVPWAGFHHFRHTAGNLWMEDGDIIIQQVSSLLGHSSIEVTQKIYAHALKSSRPTGAALEDAVAL